MVAMDVTGQGETRPEGNPTEGAAPGSRRQRLALGATLALIAGVLVLGAQSEPEETGERLGRRVELVELIAAEQERTRQLERQVEELAEQVGAHEINAAHGADELDELRTQVEAISVPAGLSAVHGPGTVVTLDDSLSDWDGAGDPNDYVIHEEDLRAVVNALWAGGAEAMAINGQRVLATTAIVCVGTTLRLNGAYYTPPYDIAVIGQPDGLIEELQSDAAVGRFLTAVDEFGLGFDIETEEGLTIPAQSSSGTTLDAPLPTGGS